MVNAVIGVRGPGRPPVLSPANQKAVMDMLCNTNKTVRECAKIFKVEPRHIYSTVGSKAEMMRLMEAKAKARVPRKNGLSKIHKSKKKNADW